MTCPTCDLEHDDKTPCADAISSKLAPFSMFPADAAKIHKPVPADKLPAKLYHGTSMPQWAFGIDKKGLRGDVPRLRANDDVHLGYVFLTDNVQEAAQYGVQTLVEAKTFMPVVKMMMERNLKAFNDFMNFGVVVEIDTSKIELARIEYDPECVDWDRLRQAAYTDTLLARFYEGMIEDNLAGVWYRYRGNIPREALKPIGQVPLTGFNSILTRTMQNVLDNEIKSSEVRFR